MMKLALPISFVARASGPCSVEHKEEHGRVARAIEEESS